MQKIADVDAKIAELQAQADAKTTDTKKEDTKKTAKKKQEVSSLTGEAVTPLEQLYIDKQEQLLVIKRRFPWLMLKHIAMMTAMV